MTEDALFLKESIAEFLNFMGSEKGLTKNSLDSYRHDLVQFEEFILTQKLNVKTLSYKKLRNFLSYLRHKNQSQRSLSRKISSTRQFFKFLVRENKVVQDPSELLSVLVKKRTLPTVLTLEEMKDILEAARPDTEIGMRDRALLEMWYSTGARVSELCCVELGDVDLKKGWIVLIGKGRKERKVPLTAFAVGFAKKYQSVRHEWIRKTQSDEKRFFINPSGDPLSRQTLWKIVKHYAKKAHISKKVWPHMIRHSFATHVLKGGADLRVVQELLGHRSISTTEIYTHLQVDDLKSMQLKFHPRG